MASATALKSAPSLMEDWRERKGKCWRNNVKIDWINRDGAVSAVLTSYLSKFVLLVDSLAEANIYFDILYFSCVFCPGVTAFFHALPINPTQDIRTYSHS